MCSSSGRLFKKAPGGTAVVPAGKSRTGRSLLKEVAHSDHCLHIATFGDEKGTGRVSEILFCAQSGAYGTNKIVRLKDRRQPHENGKRMQQWLALNVRRVHPTNREALTNINRARVLGEAQQYATGQQMMAMKWQLAFRLFQQT